MTIYFCDLEANGLLTDATKIHCVSVKALDYVPATFTDTDEFVTFLTELTPTDTMVLHNGYGYDLELLKKLGVIKDWSPTTVTLMDGTVKNVQLIDTLALSREWWPDNPRGHGLLTWSKFLGTYKPHIEDWENLPIEDYIERCEEDVITTEKVFLYLADKLGVEL